MSHTQEDHCSTSREEELDKSSLDSPTRRFVRRTHKALHGAATYLNFAQWLMVGAVVSPSATFVAAYGISIANVDVTFPSFFLSYAIDFAPASMIGALGLAISAVFFILVTHARYEQVKHLNDAVAPLSSPNLSVKSFESVSVDKPSVLSSCSNLSVLGSESVSEDKPSESMLENGVESADDILVENPFDVNCTSEQSVQDTPSTARTQNDDDGHQRSSTRRIKRWNRAGLFFGYTCAFGMAGVGAFPQHNGHLAHDTLAGIYFVSAAAWMTVHSVITGRLASRHKADNHSLFASERRLAYIRASLTVVAFFSALMMQIIVDYIGGTIGRAIAATLELLMGVAWLVFILTLSGDFSRLDIKLFQATIVRSSKTGGEKELLLEHASPSWQNGTIVHEQARLAKTKPATCVCLAGQAL